ncbi:hypothetical protein C2E23DRAFT_273325 [Lenzites betulinus]|nr:hypothetical protein C2E23DRAFT_273325 [Lenzites betulinus]
MNLVHAPTPARQPLCNRTNAPRFPKVYFKLPIFKKSAPTVSITNTNAARTNTSAIPTSTFSPLSEVVVSPQSFVPFPSSPIPCPPPRQRSASEEGYCSNSELQDLAFPGEKETEMQTATSRHGSHTDIHRRRSKSCLPASFLQRDAKQRKNRIASEKPAVPQRPATRVAARRESMSAGNPTRKAVRKAKRLVADAQFLASIHSTIASGVRARIHTDGGSDEYTAQDALLVDRIWRTLVDLGYQPVPIESSTAAPSSLPPISEDPVREAAERAARRTVAASSLPTPLDPAHDMPLIPSGELAVPQLVAILTMRHRDRSTTRPRSAAKSRADKSPARSPLSITCLSASLDVPVLSSSG